MKKFLSLFMAVIMSFTLCTPALAANNTSQVIYADDGSYFVVQEDPISVAYFGKDGHLLDKSWFDTTSNEIITQIFDSDSGSNFVCETTVLDLDSLVIENLDNHSVSVRSDVQNSSRYVYDDEPLLDNSGMAKSNIFPGWYEIGTYRNTIYPDYTATVVRNFSGEHYSEGEAHRLRITKGTPASTITASILSLTFTGGNIGAAAAAAFTQFVTSIVKDSLDVTFTYHSFHYKYQVGINSSNIPQHKYCRSIDLWYCEGGGESTYEYRGATAGHLNGTNHSDQALTAIANYTMGKSPTGSFCGI